MYLEKVSSQAISKAKSKIDDAEIFDLKYLEKNGYRLSYYYDIPDKVFTYSDSQGFQGLLSESGRAVSLLQCRQPRNDQGFFRFSL